MPKNKVGDIVGLISVANGPVQAVIREVRVFTTQIPLYKVHILGYNIDREFWSAGYELLTTVPSSLDLSSDQAIRS